MSKSPTINLNAAQAEAINIVTGPALVVAGAGTGKTKVITERIAKLIASGIDRQAILALTFTDKAAQEMLDRVSDLLEQSYGVELNIFTFNAFGQEMLREFAIEIGHNANMRLVGDTGKAVLLREHLDELGLDYFSPISSPDGQLASLSDYFSKLKQQLIKPVEYQTYAQNLPSSDDAERLDKQRHAELANAFAAYLRITRERNIIDYDDQLYLLIELLEKRPNVLNKLQQRYAYVLVDEFQDTNPMQSRLLDLLAAKHNNIMAVGDDDQSIYGWRGATLANILQFKDRYPEAKEITLIENFRSTQEILDTAYHMIQHNNPDRLEAINGLDKRLVAHKGSGTMPSLSCFSSLEAELAWVARDIEARLKKGQDPGSIAILTRRNAGVKQIHGVLDAHNIEHTISGVSNDMYQQPIIGTMIEALKCVVDPHDNQALYHTLSGPLFACPQEALADVSARIRRNHMLLEQALAELEDETFTAALTMLKEWRSSVHELSVGALAYTIIDQTGLKQNLYSKAEESYEGSLTVQVLGQWFSSLRDFEQVADIPSAINYLQNLPVLRAEGELLSDEAGDTLPSAPIVMSVHKAKGLEWDTVYIVDCTENTFPLRRSSSSLTVPPELTLMSSADDHYSEERRLMYVALTRARKELILTYSETHNGVTKRKPSRFLVEMFADHLSPHMVEELKQQISLDLFSIPNVKPAEFHLPPHLVSGQNLILTASQANDYLRCPLDFKYRHILNVPVAASPASAVGTLLHSLIQSVNDARIKNDAVPGLADLAERLEGNWPQDGYTSALQRDRARDQATAAFGQLYERLLSEPIPLKSEEPFRVHIPNSRLILKGRIDAIMPTTNGVEIRDYKTSTSATTPQKAKQSTQSSKQLEMYALAWLLKTGELPVSVSLDFVLTNQIGTVKKQAKTIDNLAAKLTSMAESIVAGEFTPGYDHRYCHHNQELTEE